jgi:Flp pilus assembly protein TadD
LRAFAFKLSKDYSAAIKSHRERVQLCRAFSPQSVHLARSLSDLAIAERDFGDLDSAERDSREALQIAQSVDDHQAVAICAANLGAIALMREDWSGAEAALREALTLSEKVGRREQVANNCHRLSLALVRQGRKSEAFPYAQRAVEIYIALRSPSLEVARQTLAECES